MKGGTPNPLWKDVSETNKVRARTIIVPDDIMSYVGNVLTLDILSAIFVAANYLKLDQTTPQEVDNGSPKFQEGLTIKSDERIYFDGT